VEVEFNLMPEDFLAFVRFRQRRRNPRPAARWPWALLLGLLVLMFFANFFADMARRGTRADGFIPGLGLGALVIAALWALVKGIVVRSQKQVLQDARNQWVFATRRVTLSLEGLSITSWPFRVSYRWEVIWDIGVTGDHAFFFVTSTEATPVPRRAFRDQQHFQEFVALARRYQQGAAPPAGIMDALPAEAPPRPTTITRGPE
jgi:hypothetical protein